MLEIYDIDITEDETIMMVYTSDLKTTLLQFWSL